MAGKSTDDLDRSQECICGAHVVIAGNGSRYDAAPGPMGTASPIRGRFHSCARAAEPPNRNIETYPKARPREERVALQVAPKALPPAPTDVPIEGEFYEVEYV